MCFNVLNNAWVEYIGFESCVWSNMRHIVYFETKVDEPEHKKYKSRDGSVKKVSNHYVVAVCAYVVAVCAYVVTVCAYVVAVYAYRNYSNST